MTSRNASDPSDDARSEPASARPGGALVERRPLLPADFLPHLGTEHAPGEDGINLREYWEIIVKRKWTVLTFLAIVFVAVMTSTLLETKIYRSTLTLQIEQQEAKVVRIEEVRPSEQVYDSREFYQTQYELLRSRALAQRVAAQLNLAEHPLFQSRAEAPGPLDMLRDFVAGPRKAEPQREPTPEEREQALASRVLGGLTVDPVRNSRLVRIHFESPDPQFSAKVANTVATEFINLNLERRLDASSYAKTFLSDRLQQIRVKLEDSEKSLNEFLRRESLVRVDDQKSGQSPESQVLQEFTGALAKAQGERIRAEAMYKQIAAADGGTMAVVLENRLIQEFKTRKAKLEADYQEGLKVFKPSYPKMLQIESQIAETQAKIDEEIAAVRAALKASYETALAQEALLSTKLQESRKTVLGVQDRSYQYNLLKRDVDTYRQLYDGLLQRYREVGVAGGIGVNNIMVVDRAEPPRAPFKPNVSRNAMLALFLGLIGGICLAFLFEHLDDSIKAPEDLEKVLGLPVLGVIPFVKHTADEDIVLAESHDPRSAFSEAYRSVRTALQFSTEQGMPKVLMITSTETNEGKSTTALSLAVHFAQAGKTVLLIDGDLRKSALHKRLGVPNTEGLTNYLAGDAQPVDITRSCSIPKLFVIPSGPLPPNPAELISSSKMVSLLTLAAERFDHVIIDGPPVLGLADAPLLGSLAEATVMVVESGSTSRRFVRRALQRLRGTRSHLLGGILTKVGADGRSYGYYSYYYRYESSNRAPQRLAT